MSVTGLCAGSAVALMVEPVVSAALTSPLRACAEGHTPPNVALMQLLAAAPDEAAARHALETAEENAVEAAARRRIGEIRRRWQEDANIFQLVKQVTHAVAQRDRAGWATTFDEVARISPEAAVALYSLGNPRLLAAATQELVAQLRAWELLNADCRVLDLGCGFGRISRAIAPDVHSVVAVEVSQCMAELARTNLMQDPNALVIRSGGDGLTFLHNANFDVVLAIDSFPYLVNGGFAERHMAEIARVLKRAGRLLIMNYSYRGDLALDRHEIAQLAMRYGFAIERNGTSDLSLWDGRAFLLRRV